MPKLTTQFKVDMTGKITQVRGKDVGAQPSFMRVLSEHESSAPPKETKMAIRGAYKFARHLQEPNAEETAPNDHPRGGSR